MYVSASAKSPIVPLKKSPRPGLSFERGRDSRREEVPRPVKGEGRERDNSAEAARIEHPTDEWDEWI